MTLCICCRKEVDTVVPVSTNLMVWAGQDGCVARTLSIRLHMELDYPEKFDTNVCQSCYKKFLKVAEVAADIHIKEQELLNADKRVARIRELKNELAALEKKV